MPEQKFNQPYYKIHFAELDDDVAGVVSFEGEEEISGLFEFRIVLASLDPKIDSKKVLNKTATFTLIRPDQSKREIHGYISNFEQTGKTREYLFYKVILVPRLWQLNLIFQSAVYQNIEMKDLIQKILEDCKLSSGDFKYDAKNNYPKSEFWVQYRETDLNFLNRRLEHYGIYYYFDQSGDEDVVCFTDDNSKLPAIDPSEKLGFNENHEPLGIKESIFEFICREKVVTGAVQLKDYNYMFPEKELISEIAFDSEYPGNFYDYGDHFENEKEGDFLAEVRSQEIFCQSKIFYGTSDCRLLSSGHKFSLEKHYRDEWNSEYIITSITHKGNQHNLFSFQHSATKDKPYENNFTAIPDAVDFSPVRRTRCPKIYGIINAKVDDSSDGKYASIDDHGRYKVKIPFDLSDKKNGEASLYIRMIQSYSGGNYGIHFPLHKGTEVLLTFIDGNPDRPVISGTAPNPSNASPVKGANQSQSVIRTAANNEIVIEDKGGSEQIHINQTCGNEVLMKAEGPEIDIKQKCGNQIIMKEAEGIHIKDKYGNEVKLDSAAGTIKIHTPSHESTIDLGKSIWLGTLSDLKEQANGNKISNIQKDLITAVYGSKDEYIVGPVKVKYDGVNASIHGGATSDSFIGAKHSFFTGLKLDQSYSKSVSYTRGTKNSKCEARDVNKTKFKEEIVDTNYVLSAEKNVDVYAKGGHVYLEAGGSAFIKIEEHKITIKARQVEIDSDLDIKLIPKDGKVTIPKGKMDDKFITSG